jgi:hypothetical protein
MRLILGSIVIAIFAGFAGAQISGNPANWCREGFFTRDSPEFSIHVVKGSSKVRAYFYGDDRDECPGGSNCRRKAFVVGGDAVLVNRTYEGYSCVWYAPDSGRPTIGWMKSSELALMPKLSDVTPKAWLGEWRFYDNSIEFTENKLPGYLNVTGNATWIGANNNVHVGELGGRYKPQNGWIEYSDGNDEFDCRVRMRLLGSYLIVADNLKCGGVNVTFSGIYRRKRK